MDPLYKALQSWKGPQSILTTLREAGYQAHTVYRDCMREFCESRCLPADLETYWEETAREYVSSGGGSGFDLGKRRKVRGYYRSPYLDRLSSESKNFVTQFRVLPSVHPCIHAYWSVTTFGGEKSLYPRIRARVEDRKYDEWTERNITGYGWNGYLKEFLLILDESAQAQGFEVIVGAPRIRSRAVALTYGVRAPNGLLFYLRADTGVYNPLGNQLPIEFWIGYEKVKDDDFYVADLRYILPGIEQYGYYAGSESAILGIKALLCAFAALARSFDYGESV